MPCQNFFQFWALFEYIPSEQQERSVHQNLTHLSIEKGFLSSKNVKMVNYYSAIEIRTWNKIQFKMLFAVDGIEFEYLQNFEKGNV